MCLEMVYLRKIIEVMANNRQIVMSTNMILLTSPEGEFPRVFTLEVHLTSASP